ncbi:MULTISPECIES: GPW/gp25 family protein [Bacteroidaceae]|uniref:GPW/gp25 family protein n=1 Tax=Phocaeicola barnesiae TaxID=376804 RepID=A0AAW5N713_9BACT|nr:MULTISPECIES: GPW/gp25 family protein [Bacteroidaceae]MBM6671789.1 GPW/gp25 family protein [Phocaeicola coprophilus]MBM6720238.1 GPW/gp25 family protein [Bacteroides gallinaceum]MBM6781688.1 GPW/gp25 family protein [Bacteroides mediterraneensis]MCR8875177.1 GPW/gp25 family protein [Phocaeicola barnesiae]
MSYIKLPMNLHAAVDGRLKRCSYEESIAQQIMLLIVSHHGEVVGREDYGSAIWDLEFNQLVKINEWEEKVQVSLIKAIQLYEKRLKNVSVKVVLSEIEDENKKNIHVRRKAQITVTGNIVSTDLPFHFNTLVYISPLSQ